MSTYTYTCDKRNLCTSVSSDIPYMLPRTVRYEYDDSGMRTQTITPSGRTVTRTIDSKGLCTGIKDTTARIGADFAYDDARRPGRTSFLNSLYTTPVLDKAGRVVELACRKTEGTAPAPATDPNVLSFQYAYTATGNRMFERTYYDLSTLSATYPADLPETVSLADVYRYDGLHRVDKVRYGCESAPAASVSAASVPASLACDDPDLPGGISTELITLDLLNNRKEQTVTIGTSSSATTGYNGGADGYTPDPRCRIKTVDDVGYSDDDDIPVRHTALVRPSEAMTGTRKRIRYYYADADGSGSRGPYEDLWYTLKGDHTVSSFDPDAAVLLPFYDSASGDVAVLDGEVPAGADLTARFLDNLPADRSGETRNIAFLDTPAAASDPAGNGCYDSCEDIILRPLPALGPYASDSLYDPERHTAVCTGPDHPAEPPELEPGRPGTPADLLLYYDADHDGVYGLGEEIWLDENRDGFYNARSDSDDILIYINSTSGTPGTLVSGVPGSTAGLYYDDADGSGGWDPGEVIWGACLPPLDPERDTLIAFYDDEYDDPVYNGRVPEDLTAPAETDSGDAITVSQGAYGVQSPRLRYSDTNRNCDYDAGEDIWYDADADGIYEPSRSGYGGDLLLYRGADGAVQTSYGQQGISTGLCFADADGNGCWGPGEIIWANHIPARARLVRNVIAYADRNANRRRDSDEPVWANVLGTATGITENLHYADLNLNQQCDFGEPAWTGGDTSSSKSWDTDGNLTDDGTFKYDWDALGHLVRVYADRNGDGDVERAGRDLIAEYIYDHEGRRILRLLHPAGGTATAVSYVYDGRTVLAEYENTPGFVTFSGETVLAEHLPGPGLDQHLAGTLNGDIVYYHQNSIGSVTALTGTGGDVIERYRYDIHGNVTVLDADGHPAGTDPRSPYLFTGRRLDPETGLYYFRNRYYSPLFGRFISPDPLDYVDGMNVYAYVNGNVTNLVDPMGMEAIRNERTGAVYWRFKDGSGFRIGEMTKGWHDLKQRQSAKSANYGYGGGYGELGRQMQASPEPSNLVRLLNGLTVTYGSLSQYATDDYESRLVTLSRDRRLGALIALLSPVDVGTPPLSKGMVRVAGFGRSAGAALEIGIGIVAIPVSGGASAYLILNGADNLQAGVRQTISGEEKQALLEYALRQGLGDEGGTVVYVVVQVAGGWAAGSSISKAQKLAALEEAGDLRPIAAADNVDDAQAIAKNTPRTPVQVGDDFSSAAGKKVYRNVSEGHPALGEASEGVVRPWGETMEELSLQERALMHDAGGVEGSGFTSWSIDEAWVLDRQRRLGGVVVETTAPSGSIWMNQTAMGAESQVLVPGKVVGKVVTTP